jgi:glutamate synthase (NADPH/NADH) large chain
MAEPRQYNLKDWKWWSPSWRSCRWKPPACSIASRPSATRRKISKFLEPMGVNGEDPLGSMGTDTPIAVLSRKSRLLYDYFKQNFAQVTNPPIDPIREELVMSLVSMIGPRPNLLGKEAGTHKRLEIDQPILTNEDVAKIRSVEAALDGAFRTATVDTTWDAKAGAEGLEQAIKEMCWAATEAVLADHNILILSDRAQGPDRIPMPALLATAAIHRIWCARACACRRGWWWKPARRARCITSARWPAMAPRRSTPMWRLKRWRTSASARGCRLSPRR